MAAAKIGPGRASHDAGDRRPETLETGGEVAPLSPLAAPAPPVPEASAKMAKASKPPEPEKAEAEPASADVSPAPTTAPAPPAPAVVEASPTRRYRVWAHGTLQRDGKVYPPGAELVLLVDVAKKIPCLEPV